MNFLAHAVLSFKDPPVLTGNLISDFIKGKQQYEYDANIQKGIRLHRMIDEFTDNHQATAAAKVFFRPGYRLYSGAFVDVVYDHFLANDKNEFETAGDLHEFTQFVYRTLEENLSVLPPVFAAIFPYMKKENWLYNYRERWGIEKSFGGLVRRATYMQDPAPAFKIFNENFQELKECYEVFFPELKQFVKEATSNLSASDPS